MQLLTPTFQNYSPNLAGTGPNYPV